MVGSSVSSNFKAEVVKFHVTLRPLSNSNKSTVSSSSSLSIASLLARFADFVRLSVYSNVTTTTSLSASLVGLSTECLSVCLSARFSLVYMFIKRKRNKTANDVRAAVALVLVFEPDDSALGC